MNNKYFQSYEEYLELQTKKVLFRKNSKGAIEEEYSNGLRAGKQKWIKKIELIGNRGGNVLVLGARWGSEVLMFREAGFKNISAIDLYDPPLSNLVKTGDAHFLSTIFSEKFDIVFAHHVFEHFFKPSEVLNEIKKVTFYNAILYIGVPFAGSRNEYDAQDEFEGADEFEDLMEQNDFRVEDFGISRRGKKKTKIYHYYIFRRVA